MAKLMNNSRLKLKEAYYVKGLGLVATDGSLIKKKLPQKKEPTAAEKAELQYGLNFNGLNSGKTKKKKIKFPIGNF